MSNKSTKASKKLSIPREMSEIQKEFQQLCASAGQTQYQISVFTAELAKLNERLGSVNREAAARNQLDMEAKKAATEAPKQTEAGA